MDNDDRYLYDHEQPAGPRAPQRSHDDLVQEFCELTQVTAAEVTQTLPPPHAPVFCSRPQANAYLSSMDWEFADAVTEFFAHHPDGQAGAEPEPEPAYSGPRTLDGRPAPQAASSSAAPKKAPKKKGLATLSSLGGGHDQDDDDEDDDEDEDDEDETRGPRDLFAGGEKSGLAVQDPAAAGPSSGTKKVIKDIIAQAKA